MSAWTYPGGADAPSFHASDMSVWRLSAPDFRLSVGVCQDASGGGWRYAYRVRFLRTNRRFVMAGLQCYGSFADALEAGLRAVVADLAPALTGPPSVRRAYLALRRRIERCFRAPSDPLDLD